MYVFREDLEIQTSELKLKSVYTQFDKVHWPMKLNTFALNSQKCIKNLNIVTFYFRINTIALFQLYCASRLNVSLTLTLDSFFLLVAIFINENEDKILILLSIYIVHNEANSNFHRIIVKNCLNNFSLFFVRPPFSVALCNEKVSHWIFHYSVSLSVLVYCKVHNVAWI